jgi:hypothetical protein
MHNRMYMETKSIGSASSLISCFEIRLHPLLIEVSVLIKLTKDKLFAFTFAKVAFFLLLLRSVDCSNGEGTHAGQLTQSGYGKLGPWELSGWIFVIFNFFGYRNSIFLFGFYFLIFLG